MSPSFYFYDTETSGASPKRSRVMQFAGQRTDLDLNPIGDPDDILIKLTPDIIPEPDAILIHKITPQQTLADGITEYGFLDYFNKNIATAGTIFVGYNNIRFDDEFIRYMSYRNFYDPYEWHYKDKKSRWDLMDAMRMMRALRPEGINWPFIDGKPTVRLESLASENKLLHTNAHNALSDVEALVELARLFKNKQPKLFEYLLKMRDKNRVAELVESGQKFLYTSGKYANENLKTTVVLTLATHPDRPSASLVFDLRFDPKPFLAMTAEQIAEAWTNREESGLKLPVKTLQYNRCPAVAPLSVLDRSAQDRIGIDLKTIEKHEEQLRGNLEKFKELLFDALKILDGNKQDRLPLIIEVDEQMYDGFWTDSERNELLKVRKSLPKDLNDNLMVSLNSKRQRQLLPLYKARNFATSMSAEEQQAWHEYCKNKMIGDNTPSSPINRFAKRMQELAIQKSGDSNAEYLLTELQLYVESILPLD